MFIVPFTMAQWSTTPNNHLMISPEGENPKACSDGDGGAYIVWKNFNYDKNRVYLQHLNKYGIRTLATPMIVCDTNDLQYKFDMVEDGYGGVLIVIGAEKVTGQIGGFKITNTKIFVQRIDKNLNKLWGPNGVRVSLKENNQNCYADPKLVSDKRNNSYIFFGDRREEDSDEKFNLYMQRIRYDGERMWSDTGITVTTNVVTPKWFLLACLTNRIIGWYAQAGGSGPWRILVGIDSLGSKKWEKTSTDSYLHFARAKNDQLFITRSYTIEGYHEIFQANLFNSNGDSLWSNWITLADSSRFNSTTSGVKTIYDTVLAVNYYRLNFETFSSEMFIQCITTTGRLLFPDRKRLSKYTSEHNYTADEIIESDSGTFISAFFDNFPFGEFNSYLQKIDLQGNFFWGDSGLLVSNDRIGDVQKSPFFRKLVKDNQGGAVAVGALEPQFGIYAAQVNKNGKLGDVITSVTKDSHTSISPTTFEISEPYPNPFNPSTTIQYRLPMRSRVRLQVFNILGQRVALLFDGEQLAGYHKVQWKATASSGIYFHRIEATAVDDPGTHFVDTKKLLLIK